MEAQTKIKEISINNDIYVLKSEIDNQKLAVNTDGLPFVMIRTYSAGVHFGFLKSKEYTAAGTIVELINSRRVYYWSGAMTLSQLSLDGTSKPNDCKFTVEIPLIELNAIEIIAITEKAKENLTSVKIWKI